MQLSSVQRLLFVQFSNILSRSARIASRPILNVVNDEGEPYRPKAEIKSQVKPHPALIKDNQIKKLRQEAQKANYFKQLDKNIMARSKSIDGIKYSYIKEHHRDFMETKLIVAKRISMRKNVVVLEGKRLINDAIEGGIVAEKLFFTDPNMLQSIFDVQKLFDDGIRFYHISDRNMRKLSKVVTPPGIIGVFVRSSDPETASRKACFPIHVIADNIRDPGNLGSLIRSSAAVGAEEIICTKGCVDPWSDKVLRSACGAHFRINIVDNFEWKNIHMYLPRTESTLLFATKLDFESNPSEETLKKIPSSLLRLRKNRHFELDYKPFKKDKLLGVIIGGETHGISSDAYKATNLHLKHFLSVPLFKGVESLNSAVAGSIILFEIQRQLLLS